MTSYIPETPIGTAPNQMTTSRFTCGTSLFPEKTRLETYVDILAMIASPNQFKRTPSYKAAYASKILEDKYALDFLTDLGLVKLNAGEPETRPDYSVTQRGKEVLIYFKYFDTLEKGQRTRALKRQ